MPNARKSVLTPCSSIKVCAAMRHFFALNQIAVVRKVGTVSDRRKTCFLNGRRTGNIIRAAGASIRPITRGRGGCSRPNFNPWPRPPESVADAQTPPNFRMADHPGVGPWPGESADTSRLIGRKTLDVRQMTVFSNLSCALNRVCRVIQLELCLCGVTRPKRQLAS
jgi:hypothetical protein